MLSTGRTASIKLCAAPLLPVFLAFSSCIVVVLWLLSYREVPESSPIVVFFVYWTMSITWITPNLTILNRPYVGDITVRNAFERQH